MGVDKGDVRHVLLAKCPTRVETYMQAVGRAGRDGEPSLCLALWDDRLLLQAMPITRLTRGSGAVEYLRRVVELLTSESDPVAVGSRSLRSCRRVALLSAVGDS